MSTRATEVSADGSSAEGFSPVAGLAEVGTRRMLLLGLLGALQALGMVLVADALANGIVTVIHHGDLTLPVLEGLAGAVIRAASVWALRVASQSTASGVKRDLRARGARALLHRPSDRVGAEATVLTTGLDDLDAYYTSYLPSLVTAATVPLLVGARILAADWVSALIIVLTVPLVPLFMALIGMHTRQTVAASLDALGRLSDHLVELARGLPVLVGLGRDREQTRALADISDDHRVRSMTALRTAFLSALALDLLSTISVAIVAVVVGIRLLHGDLPLEAGLVALILAPECYAPIRDIGAAFHASDTGREALRRVRAVFDRTPVRDRSHGAALPLTSSQLEAADLSVTYPGRTRSAVSHLSFTIAPHSITLLAGDSGAGKSTVLALLAGRGAQLDPEARVTGRLSVPDADRTVWMPQHPRFSSGTVLDEVALYGTPTTDAPALLDRVGLAQLAAHSPAELSPGEARRLAFARVLAAVDAGSSLVLLDEPTAHLDERSAAGVREAIRQLRSRATVVLASHDPMLHTIADDVIPVDRAGWRAGDSDRDRDVRSIYDRAHAQTAPMPVLTVSVADQNEPPSRRAVLGELGAFLRPVRLRMAAATLIGVLSTLFAITLTALSGWLIVRASQEPAIMYLLVAIVGVRFFGIGRSVLRYAERLMTHDTVLRAVTVLRVRLWTGLAAKGPAGRSALSPANTMHTLVGAADRVRDLVPRVVQPPVTAVVVVIGAAVSLGIIFPPAALLTAVCALVAVIGAPIVAVVGSRVAARRGETSRRAVMNAVTGGLIASDDLTSHAAEGVLDRIARADLVTADAERRGAFVEGAASALATAACCITAVLMLPLAAGAVVHGELRPELIAVLALVPLALIEPLAAGVTAAAKAPALAEVLGVVSAAAARSTTDDDAASETAPIIDGIVLDDVAFGYEGSDHAVFEHVSAAVDRGQWLAVTGPSGCGKSTLLALLLRFIAPGSGDYLLHHDAELTNAERVRADALRSRVAWCPQEGHLFDSTLRANLAIARGRDDAPTDAELAGVLDRVGLADLVASLPDGLDTRIGAAGSRLSGGQRQRVAVARTLLTRGDVVLIDEPTAQLDEQASRELMADLRGALNASVAVLVTHDPDEARAADHVLSLAAPQTADRTREQAHTSVAA